VLLSGASVSAAEGHRLGFVNEVVPADRLAETTGAWVEQILKCAPLSVRASKETALRGLDEPSLQAALAAQNDYPAYAAWRQAEDTREGPRAFAEKRAPVWRGR